jgi:hypothetical protein
MFYLPPLSTELNNLKHNICETTASTEQETLKKIGDKLLRGLGAVRITE